MEKFPQNSESKPEHEPVTYERVLAAAQALKRANIKDPLESGDPLTLEAHDLIEQWKLSKNLHMRGIDSIQKAADIVRAALLWIEAGYDDLQNLKDAMDTLADEYADALRDGNEGGASLIKSSLDALEEKIGRRNASEKIPAKLAAKVQEAQERASSGRIVDAVGILTLALFDPRFKRLPKNILQEIQRLRDDYKAQM